MIEVAAERWRRETNLAMSQAWHSAALYRTDRMPPLSKLIDRGNVVTSRPQGPRNAKEALSLFRRLNAAYGGIDRRKPN